MITTKLLKSIGACEDGITFFKDQFPSGKASFSKVINTCLDCKHRDYAVWLAHYCPNMPGATWKARLALQRYEYERAGLARFCPDIPGATWEARLALQRNKEELLFLAHSCPDIPGATWKVRLALQDEGYERSYFARHCPDIPGATWEVRLALQLNGYERGTLEELFPEPVHTTLGKGKPNPNP